jgi:mannose-6-phosphate isomerase-like protein (cupin superfamily)
MKSNKAFPARIGVSVLLFAVMVITVSAVKFIQSGVYDWNKLKEEKTHTGWVRNILKGPTQSLESFDIKVITLYPAKVLHTHLIEKDCDELIIIKEGSAEISINSEKKTLAAGSIAVASQGERLTIGNPMKENLVIYSFLFKPRKVKQGSEVSLKVKPVLTDWNSVAFKPSANGGRRDIIKQRTSSLKELEMHTTTLNEGLPSHAAHNHADEEIILVRFGTVEQTINGVGYKLGPGSVIFLSNNDNHGISNAGSGKCEYYAIRWLTYQDSK